MTDDTRALREAAPTFANTGVLTHHDLGCRCWPHVSERNALDAIAAGALAEYRDARAALAAEPVASADEAHVHDGCFQRGTLTADYIQSAIEATIRGSAGLDVEAARLVFHNEYESDHTGDRYYGCQHRNQHRSTWDCQQRVDEFAAEYARLARTTEEQT